MEIIEIRSLTKKKEELEEQLYNFCEEMKCEYSAKSIQIFVKANLDTDFVILLHNDSITIRKGGSHIGKRLTSALGDYGMINHTVWNEINT
jgi:hypothetical protein